MKQNAIEVADKYPQDAEVVHKFVYVNDALTGAIVSSQQLVSRNSCRIC